jgi:hypothetical protein
MTSILSILANAKNATEDLIWKSRVWRTTSTRASLIMNSVVSWTERKVVVHVPRTRPYKQRTFMFMLRKTRSRCKVFAELSAVGHDTKVQLSTALRSHEIKLAATHVLDDLNDDLISTAFYTGLLVLFLLVPVLVAVFSGLTPQEVPVYILLYLVSTYGLFLVESLCVLAMNVLGRILPHRVRSFPYFVAVIAMPIINVNLITDEITGRNIHISPTILAAFAAAAAVGLFFILAIIIAVWRQIFSIWYGSHLQSHNADDSIIDGCLLILRDLEQESDQWGTPRQKQQLLARLDRIARMISHGLVQQVRINDASAKMWFLQMTEEMAEYVRALEKWVLIPKPDTHAHLVERIASNLVVSISGCWDEFPREPLPKVTRPQRLYVFLTYLRTFFLALLPLVIIWLIQQSPVAMQGDVANYAVAGAIIWAVLSFMSVLDPTMSAKVGVLKDVTSIIPFPGQKKS